MPVSHRQAPSSQTSVVSHPPMGAANDHTANLAGLSGTMNWGDYLDNDVDAYARWLMLQGMADQPVQTMHRSGNDLNIWQRVRSGIGGVFWSIGSALSGLGAVVTSETGVGAVALGASSVYMGDHALADFREVFSGTSQEDYLEQGLEHFISPQLTHKIDFGLGLGLALPEAVPELFSLGAKGVNTGAGLLSRIGLFGDAAVGGEKVSELEPGLYHLNPKDIRFTQPNAGPFFSNGSRIDELIPKLKSGEVSPYDLPPIQVVQKNGKLFSIDNRRLVAFNAAGVDKVPVQVVSLDDPLIAEKVRFRFDPILGEGQYTVVVPKVGRAEALELLEKYEMIKGISNGY